MKEGLLHGPKGLAGQLMRKHDSEAGRRAIRSRMQRVCKCHGKRHIIQIGRIITFSCHINGWCIITVSWIWILPVH